MASPLSKIKSYRVALVGAETLLGRELQDVIQTRKMGAVVVPYAASGEGNFGEQEGEAIYFDPLDAKTLNSNRAILMAGSPVGATKVYTLAKDDAHPPTVIDCVGHLENQPEARIVAPLLADANIDKSWLLVLAHPAAAALALIFERLVKFGSVRQSLINIFEPASERGKQGVSELHTQTAKLLAFKSFDKPVFDAQLGFNLLPQYGEDAPLKLSAVEQRIERHLVTLLSRQNSEARQPSDAGLTETSNRQAAAQALPGMLKSLPSLRLIQAPIFHGYSMSAWVEFENKIDEISLGEALASAQIEVRGSSDEAPTSVSAASQSGLIVGDIRVDRNNPRAAWFWIVADNLRLTSDGASELINGLAN